MAARLGCRQKAVNQKMLVKIMNFGAASALPEDAVGTCEPATFSRRDLRCSSSHKTFYIGSAGIFTDMSEREKKLTINEIYHSIQGESTWVGWPCVFVRLTFCNLRCNYCDTEYAFYKGIKRSLDEILNAVAAYRCPLVEITGGEPLLQKNVLPLMSMLCDSGY